jgi:hypothetical protein
MSLPSPTVETAEKHSLANEDIPRVTSYAAEATLHPSLTEDAALAVLKRHNLTPEILEQLSKHRSLVKSRKVKRAIAGHPKTPRHVAIPMMRHLFTFDLMQIALTPQVQADVKLAAENALLSRLETISAGERLTLARRASAGIAGALLADSEPRVIHAALENSRLTESVLIRALLRPHVSAVLVEAVCRHSKWSLRREIRIALLQNEKTPPPHALEFAHSLPSALLHEVLQRAQLPERVKTCMRNELAGRVR